MNQLTVVPPSGQGTAVPPRFPIPSDAHGLAEFRHLGA